MEAMPGENDVTYCDSHKLEADVVKTDLNNGDCHSNYGERNAEKLPNAKKLNCLQRLLYDIRFFVGCLAFTVGLYAMITTYKLGTLTTIEKRYNLNSSELGSLTSLHQVGTLITVIFCGYLGGLPESHRPRWISVGLFIIAIGVFCSILPHLTLGTYVYPRATDTNNDSVLANVVMCKELPLNRNQTITPNSDSTSCDVFDKEEVQDGNVAYLCFALSALIMGVGYSPVSTLGSAFVDDSVKHTTSALYLGIINMMWGFGPIVGWIVAAVSTLVFVDLGRVNLDNVDMSPDDPRWVGAWWIGGVIVLPLMIMMVIPIFLVPKDLNESRMCMKSSNQNGSDNRNENLKQKVKKDTVQLIRKLRETVKDFLKALWRLIKNPHFILVNAAYAVELGCVFGLITFIPKYIQEEFHVTPLAANITTGMATGVPYGIGMLLGGYVIKRFNIIREKSIAMLLVITLGTSATLSLMLFPLGCSGLSIHGEGTVGQYMSMACADNCHCSPDMYQPVCGSNGMTYVSPCHAGCTQLNDNGTYLECSCDEPLLTGDKISSSPPTMAEDGICHEPERCTAFIPFVILVFFLSISCSFREVPAMILAIRSVDKNDKSFALAVRFLLVRCLGPIPIPLLYGVVIDNTCSLWKTFCNGSIRGDCLFYDNDLLRYSLVGLTFALKCASCLMFVFLYLLWKYR
uniref:Solute carrier organic anion transporter family member n=1 Tax=Saccoglossus kowalevskii TaxID=10224 RepID=A0ABM0M9Y5_SACKO